jgi:hypothetical protein
VKFDAERHPVAPVDGGGTGWLTDGREYRVIEVVVEARQGSHHALLRLAADDGTPALFDARCFAVVDAALPPFWHVELSNDHTTIGPPDFQAPGFWESFFNREEAAVATFDSVLAE